MSHEWSIRFWMLCVVASLSSNLWCQSRQMEVEVVDETAQPLAGASVLVRAGSPRTKAGVPSSDDTAKPVLPRTLATTDDKGRVIVDISDLVAADSHDPLTVYAWKKGYGLQGVWAHQRAQVRCWPVQRRSLQIVDADGRPVVGWKVQHVQDESVSDDQKQMRWWTDEDLVTNEFGLVTLDSHASGWLAIQVTSPEGVTHRCSINELGRSTGRAAEFRDLITLRLNRHGKVEGQLPSEFIKDYELRLVRDYRSSPSVTTISTTLESPLVMDDDGRFRWEAVAEGSYWLVVNEKKLAGLQTESGPKQRPDPLTKLEVSAGQTTSVTIKAVPVARVTGRVVSESADSDLSNFDLAIYLAPESEANLRAPQRHLIGRTKCATDGTFVSWLPSGRYQLLSFNNHSWKSDKPLEFEIGSGAAMVSAGELKVSPLNAVQVVWRHDTPVPNSLQSPGDHRLTFRFKDNQSVSCTLTADGYGRVYVPLEEKVISIHREVYLPNSNSNSAFVDRDDSENFDLQLITEPQGLSSNVSLRGRVVDSAGQGVLGVPVTLSLGFQPVADGTPEAMATAFQNGMQTLDVVKTEADGSFQIPPRQILSRLTIPNREVKSPCKFTFGASVYANPRPKEVQTELTVKLEEWNAKEIVLPDLVIDPIANVQNLSGLLLDGNGQPSPGEIVQVADKQRLIRTITDRSGKLTLPELSAPTWLLRGKDWSIHAINDLGKPIEFQWQAGPAKEAAGTAFQRMPLDERRKLAKELLQAGAGGPIVALGGVAQPVPGEFYLEPEQTLERILSMQGDNADLSRLQFANIWSDASEEQLQKLADAMTGEMLRFSVLRILADRKPNGDAYERLMESLRLPEENERSRMNAESLLADLASIGVKLHNFGRLDPYREKIRQFVDQHMASMNRPVPNVPGRPNAPARPMMRPGRTYTSPTVQLCRALVDPEQFALNVLEAVEASRNELSPEERSTHIVNVGIFLQLFPREYRRIPNDQLALSDAVMISWGEQAPLGALEAYQQGKLTPDLLRVVAQSALACEHPDAHAMFAETVNVLANAESPRPRFTANLGTPAEIAWYLTARATSPDFGKQAAWLLARDYLAGRFESHGFGILPFREPYAEQGLAIAYCLLEEQPQLASEIIQRAVPRALQQMEESYDQPFIRPIDMSLVAWFDPQAASDLVIKLGKRLDEERKQNAANAAARANPLFYSKAACVATMRQSCLRGLLLNRL